MSGYNSVDIGVSPYIINLVLLQNGDTEMKHRVMTHAFWRLTTERRNRNNGITIMEMLSVVPVIRGNNKSIDQFTFIKCLTGARHCASICLLLNPHNSPI